MGELIAKLWVDVKEENLREELYKMNANGGVAFDEEGRMLLEVTFDGTWSTRGYSSMLGFATYFGVYSKKPLFTAYRCKVIFLSLFLLFSFYYYCNLLGWFFFYQDLQGL